MAPNSVNFDSNVAAAINGNIIGRASAVKGKAERTVVSANTFSSNTAVHAELHSDPVNLGDYTSTSDGAISTNITIPNTVQAGYHTLILSGLSPAGTVVDVTQIILVKGADANDIDENGIPDSQQVCGTFITASGADTDYDGVDDACDPEITQPLLYTARNGDAAIGEDTSKIYLFRNTRASSITGILNDFVDTTRDAKNKDALIGASQSVETSGTYSKMVMIPVILIKDSSGVCIAIQPNDTFSPALDPANQGYQPRGFTKLTEVPKGVSCE